MSLQTWRQVLAVQRVAGAALNTFTTAKSVIDSTALYTLPSNYLSVGSILRVRATGSISNIVTTPGTMNFQVKLGSVAAFDTGQIQLNATAHTTIPFWLDIELTVRAIGSGTAANLMGLGLVVGKMFTLTAGQTDDAQGHMPITVPVTAPAVGTGFDSTIANIVDFWAGFSISNVGNQIQIQQYSLESGFL